MNKSELRQSALKARRSLSKADIEALSSQVQRRVLELREFSGAKVIASYVAKGDEVQTNRIIDTALSSGKVVLVPRTDPATLRLDFCAIHSPTELAPGYFGILEPSASAKILPLSKSQLVVVPIVAWDERGHRLGYGKGYFDRALKSKREAVSVGLGLESQRFNEVPGTTFDVPLDIIVTERRTLRLRREADA